MLKEAILASAILVLLAACFVPQTNRGSPTRWIRIDHAESFLLIVGIIGIWAVLRWLMGLPLPIRSKDAGFYADGTTGGISVPDTSDAGGGDGD
ncbi:MAG: hypothetical protein ABL904_27625 [Hyphomicrobiaceae bacterium]